MADHDEISIHLPRTLVGGLRKGPVEDLLRRIAHDYEQLELENKKLWATLEQFGEAGAGADDVHRAAAPEAASSEAYAGVDELWSTAPPDPLELPGPLPLEPVRSQPEGSESEGSESDLAAAVLVIAQRAANELRESARAECELMLKKARAHLEKLERESEHNRAATAAELVELQAMRVELREHMRGSLQALLRTFVAERSGGGQPSFEWREPPAFLEPSGPDRPGRKKKKHKP